MFRNHNQCQKFLPNVYRRSRSFEHRICAQTQDLQIFKKFTVYSVQLPYFAGYSLKHYARYLEQNFQNTVLLTKLMLEHESMKCKLRIYNIHI